MKRLIALVLAMMLALLTPGALGEDAETLTDGGFTYVILEDGTASITDYSLTGNIVIPETLGGLTVTNLSRQLFFGDYGVTSVSIPKTVTYFGTDSGDNAWDYVFSYCRNLKSITVAADNPTFKSVDGVLFTKNGRTLINYPCDKEGEEYHVPEEVRTLCCTSFASAEHLKSLYLDGGNTSWYTYTFYNDGDLTVYVQPDSVSSRRMAMFIENGLYRGESVLYNTYEVLQPKLTGWQETDGVFSYYDEDGQAVTGWRQIGGVWYYFDAQGVMQTGWQKLGGTWYYFRDNGSMATAWVQSGGKWYYFSASGAMVTGWRKIGGVSYYFNASGAMATGWQKIGGVYYSFSASGKMLTGWQKIGGVYYYFDASGKMLTGWQKISGVYYYFSASGAMATGWQKIGGVYYYFNSSGKMLTGWQKISAKWYYFQSSGAMTTGWKKIDGDWYYFTASGDMVTGARVIDGKTHLFNASGVWQGEQK